MSDRSTSCYLLMIFITYFVILSSDIIIEVYFLSYFELLTIFMAIFVICDLSILRASK